MQIRISEHVSFTPDVPRIHTGHPAYQKQTERQDYVQSLRLASELINAHKDAENRRTG